MDITVWYLSTCSTCSRILKQLDLDASKAQLIDIKSHPVTGSQLEVMKEATGSYKELINGRSIQFRNMDKKARDLSESEAKNLLLKHYAFLKRPVIQIDGECFVGNSKKTLEEVKNKINNG